MIKTLKTTPRTRLKFRKSPRKKFRFQSNRRLVQGLENVTLENSEYLKKKKK